MKRYYIYMQKALVLKTDIEYVDLFGCGQMYERPLRYTCIWSPFECLEYVEGTKELYAYLGNDRHGLVRHSFNFTHESFTVDAGSFITGHFKAPESIMKRYVIIDESGRIRNYQELIRNVRKSGNRHRNHRAYQYRYAEIASELRQSLTPEEIREYRDSLGILMESFKPKRKQIDWWNTEGCRKVSRCWKDQSKRRHQYR